MTAAERQDIRWQLRAAQSAIRQVARHGDRLPPGMIRQMAQILGELEAALRDCHDNHWKETTP